MVNILIQSGSKPLNIGGLLGILCCMKPWATNPWMMSNLTPELITGEDGS